MIADTPCGTCLLPTHASTQMESLSSPSRQQLQDCVLVATAAYEEACEEDPGEDFQSTGVLEAKMKLAIACLADFVAKIGAEPRETRPESPAATSAHLDTRSSGRNPAVQRPEFKSNNGNSKHIHPFFSPGGKSKATVRPPKKKAKSASPTGATRPHGVAGAGGSGGGGRNDGGGIVKKKTLLLSPEDQRSLDQFFPPARTGTATARTSAGPGFPADT